VNNVPRPLMFLVVCVNLTPVSPLQPETLRGNGKYLWLERGVKVRGVDPTLKHLVFPGIGVSLS